jgi:hypothetical protein
MAELFSIDVENRDAYEAENFNRKIEILNKINVRNL